MTSATEHKGTHPLRVRNDVGVDVPIDVGVADLETGRRRSLAGGHRRAAELASEAARAEGASHYRPRQVASRRGAGQAVMHEWGRRLDLRCAGELDIRA
jgi:hypothetical protein